MSGQSFAIASSSSLCLLPWSSQNAEPLLISLPGSCNGSVAASSDFVFVATCAHASEIQFFDPREPQLQLSRLVQATSSSSPNTPITALLCRSRSTLLFARGNKIYSRSMDSSKVKRVTSVSILFMVYTFYIFSKLRVRAMARIPKGQLIA